MKNQLIHTVARHLITGLALLLFLAGVAASQAQNYRLIAMPTGTNKIVEINTTSGAVSNLFDLPFTSATADGMDYNPADGFIYVAHATGSGAVEFYRLNLTARVATLAKIISGTGDGSTESIGFTPSGDVYLYDERSAFTTGTLYFMNWSNASIQTLGSSGTPSMLGGDYDAVRNVFWASDEWNAKVYQLSVTNSAILWTSQSTWFTGNGPGGVLDMDVAPNGDVLVGATDDNADVFRILKVNPVTGVWTNWLAVAGVRDYRFCSVPVSAPVITGPPYLQALGPALVSTLAGSGTIGSTDATGTAASFNNPIGMVVDAAGNLYVADGSNYKIRKIAPGGEVSTLAGSGSAGSADGTGTNASFYYSEGMALDAAGNLYVADVWTHKIRKITPGGVVSTLAGSGSPGTTDGTGAAASFWYPKGTAVDTAGNVYVSDGDGHKIRKITPGGVVSTLAGSGITSSIDGIGTAASFNRPHGLAVDAAGNVYVADRNNHKIRKITPGGMVSTLAGSGSPGSTDGTGTAASFNAPYGMAVDTAGNLYVTENNGHKIRKITPSGVVSTLAGSGTSGSANGIGTSASFNTPLGVAVDAAGSVVYVADSYNHRIRKIIPVAQVSTLAGSGAIGTNDATGTAASFRVPIAVAVDAAGNTYVADTGNHKIRKVTRDAVVSTLAGNGTAGSTDATGTAAELNDPYGVAVDTAGNVYVADTGNRKIRKITPGGVVSTLAGSDTGSDTGSTGTTVSLNAPRGVALDTAGNIYVADTGNHKIRKITPGGVVSTLAGSGSPGTNDAAGTSASFDSPWGIAVDAAGNVYVADEGNHKIRKITPGGMVSTLAGSGGSGSANGTGAAASFFSPRAVAVDAAGNVFVADGYNSRVRQITPGGMVSTLAGTSSTGNADGPGTTATLGRPYGVAVDVAGNVYVGDAMNHNIRKITLSADLGWDGLPGTVELFAGGSTLDLRANITGTEPMSYQWLKNGAPINGAVNPIYAPGLVQAGHAGTYQLVITNVAGSTTSTPLTVAVHGAPTITWQSPSSTNAAGSQVVLSVDAFTFLSGNLLTNGGFEDGLNSWAAAGGTVGLTTNSYSGQSAGTITKTAGSYARLQNNAYINFRSNRLYRAAALVKGGYFGNSEGFELEGFIGFNESAEAKRSLGAWEQISALEAFAQDFTGRIRLLNWAAPPPDLTYIVDDFELREVDAAPLSYQWQFNGSNITGATNATLTLSNVLSSQTGNYTVVAANAAGSVTSAPLAVVVYDRPTISQQPQSLTVNVTSNATFSVTATGGGVLSYQWRFNGSNLTGRTNATLTLSNVQTNQAGTYSVVVANAAGSVTSSVVGLTVNRLAQTITFGALPLRRVDDPPFSLNATASSGLPVSYSSSAPSVATVSGNTVTLTGVGSTIITASQAGNATYLPASNVGQILVVAAPPGITSPPTGQSFALGGGVTLSVTAGGTGPFSYQWQFNGVNLPGANGPSLSLTNLTATNAGAYRVIISNAVGTVTSDAVGVYCFGDLRFYAGTILAGPVGQEFRVDYADVVTVGTTNWLTLTNVILPSSPFLVVDPTSPGRTQRYYRAVPVP